jgi:hypothetical protein
VNTWPDILAQRSGITAGLPTQRGGWIISNDLAVDHIVRSLTLTATVFRAPGPGWAFVAVCALVGLWILPQLRTGGMTVTREGLRSRRRGDLVPWADVQELRGTATALKLVTRQETFTLAQAGSPEPLAMVLAERIQAARGDATD